MHPIDQVHLAFSSGSLSVLNAILGLILFGVALDLKMADFARVARDPRGIAVGVACQLAIMPALTFALTRLLDPAPSVALGMLLVAACPGGNVSNFITHVGRGDTGLSVSLTAISTTVALVSTPILLAFWGSLDPGTAAILQDLHLDVWQLLRTLGVLLGLPLVAGMSLARWAPGVAAVLRKPFKWMSLVFFGLFVVVAFQANFDHFLSHIQTVFVPVALQNALALAIGYGASRAVGLSVPQARAVSIEVGIQNSGLGLVVIFGFFQGLGGMAVIAGWWGIWHILAGLSLAGVWGRIEARREAAA